MLVSNPELMSTHSLRGATMRLALIACMLFCGVQRALAQQQVRYPQLLEHGGKQFAAYVNEINGTPTWILDPDSLDFTLGTPMTLSSESGVETAADAFVEDAKALFGIDPKNLEGPTMSRSDEVWLISYQQTYSNLRVLGAQLGLTVTRQGRLLAAGARLFPKVNVNTTPSLTASAAMEAAMGHASIPDADVSAKDELVILAVEEDGAYVYGLAWEITVSNPNLKPPRSKTFLVDAHSGKILHERDNISRGGHLALAGVDHSSKTGGAGNQAVRRAEDVTQTECPGGRSRDTFRIQGNISLNYYRSPSSRDQALHRVHGAGFPYAKFSVAKSTKTFSCTGYADADGNYSVNVPNEGTYTVTFHVASDSAFAETESGTTLPRDCLLTKSFTIAVTGSRQTARLDYDWGWGISGDGGVSSHALNGVYHTRAMKDYFWNTHGTATPAQVMKVRIALTLRAAAFLSSVDPSVAVGGAAAMSNDVIMHEYAHHIVDKLVTAGIGNELEPVQEAAADYLAADASGDGLWGGPVPTLGVDPALDAAAGDLTHLVRDLNNNCTKSYEECGDNDEYEKSRILSGAVWSLRKELNEARATRLFYRALEMRPQPPDFVTVARHMISATENAAERTAMKKEFMDRYIIGPEMPQNVTATCNSDNYIVVRWVDAASNESGYLVEREDDGDWSEIERLAADVMQYHDVGSPCNTTPEPEYVYRVAAFRTFGSANDRTVETYSTEVHYPPRGNRTQLRASRLAIRNEIQFEEAAKFNTELRSVYPNPFNPVTTISYTLKEEGHVSMVIYDVLGRRVVVLVDGIQTAGQHSITFDATRLPSGPYFVRMEASAYRRNRLMLLAK